MWIQSSKVISKPQTAQMATMEPLALVPFIRASTGVPDWFIEWNFGSIYFHNRSTNTSIAKRPPELQQNECVDRLIAPWRLELSFGYRQLIIRNIAKQISRQGCSTNLLIKCYKIARQVEFTAFINADKVSAYKMAIGTTIYNMNAKQQQQQQQQLQVLYNFIFLIISSNILNYMKLK